MRIDVEIEGMDEALKMLEQVPLAVERKAVPKALRKLGAITTQEARRRGAKSSKHRPPGKKGQDKWRNEVVHAIDTIKPGGVRRDTGGVQYVNVGPEKGDNSASFYLKFFEYGSIKMAAKPFLRPARHAVMKEYAVPEMQKAIDEELEKVR